MDINNMKKIKKLAASEYENQVGIVGFGLGKDSLRVYVEDWQAAKNIPSTYHGLVVEIVPTGKIEAQSL